LPELKSLLINYQLDPQFGKVVFFHRYFSLKEDKERLFDPNRPDAVVSSVSEDGRPNL
jgi:hypothetical protein